MRRAGVCCGYQKFCRFERTYGNCSLLVQSPGDYPNLSSNNFEDKSGFHKVQNCSKIMFFLTNMTLTLESAYVCCLEFGVTSNTIYNTWLCFIVGVRSRHFSGNASNFVVLGGKEGPVDGAVFEHPSGWKRCWMGHETQNISKPIQY
jgi:hypothetical protein